MKKKKNSTSIVIHQSQENQCKTNIIRRLNINLYKNEKTLIYYQKCNLHDNTPTILVKDTSVDSASRE